MKEEVETRIRVTGEGAERVRAYLTEKIPEAEIVGTGDPAEFVMTAGEEFNEAVEDAAATAPTPAQGAKSACRSSPSIPCCPARARSGSGSSTVE